jgi:hypothetical protein
MLGKAVIGSFNPPGSRGFNAMRGFLTRISPLLKNTRNHQESDKI